MTDNNEDSHVSKLNFDEFINKLLPLSLNDCFYSVNKAQLHVIIKL